ncbi:hypothetical protein FXO37_20888 [Capsicum annuum]|nr:hypothetical protein FXO37_20888 [Capsicum annuum]
MVAEKGERTGDSWRRGTVSGVDGGIRGAKNKKPIGVLLVMAAADLGGDGGAVWHHSWHRHWWVIENSSSWQSHIDFFWDGMDGFCWWSSDEKEKRQSGQR